MKINKANLKFGKLSNRSTTKRIVLHHAAATTASVETVHGWHLGKGWSGIGYHFYIRKDGTAWEGRPIQAIGAHVTNHNSDSIGVCFEGNFESDTMSQAQINAGINLIAYIKSKYSNLTVQKHRDLASTACPGRNFPFAQITGGTATATPTPSTSTALPQISNGSKGTAVKTLQTKLNSLGYDCGAVDGIFGKNTEAATKAFQKLNGLTADGICGPLTWSKLNSAKPVAKITGTTTQTAPAKSSGNSFVKSVQSACNSDTGSKLAVDGLYGPLTAAALPLRKQGSKGALVKCIQQKVGATADGIYGAKTKAAVIVYQNLTGLSADGIVGKNTWRVMLT